MSIVLRLKYNWYYQLCKGYTFCLMEKVFHFVENKDKNWIIERFDD